MLLRAGLIYVLSVLTVLLGGLAAWQHLDIAVRNEDTAALGHRITALQKDLDALRRREEAAVRRALVAEDSLSRNDTYNSSDAVQLNAIKQQLAEAQREKADAETLRIRLDADLAMAIGERDAIRIERDELQRTTDEARVAAGKALQEADIARQQMVDLKKAAAAAPVAPQSQAPVANVTSTEAKVVPDELVRPAADAAANNGDTKATLVPNAVTIEPASKTEMKVEKAPAAKRDFEKSGPRKPATSKAATASKSAAKKPPKQAKKDEAFFPF